MIDAAPAAPACRQRALPPQSTLQLPPARSPQPTAGHCGSPGLNAFSLCIIKRRMDPTHRADVGVPAPGFAEAWSRQRFHRIEVLFHDFQEIPINNDRLSTSIRSGRFASLGHEWELGMTIRRESRRFGLDTSGPATVDFCLYNMSDAEIAIESKIEVSGVNTSTKIMRVGRSSETAFAPLLMYRYYISGAV